jgi:hypothetical protein
MTNSIFRNLISMNGGALFFGYYNKNMTLIKC